MFFKHQVSHVQLTILNDLFLLFPFLSFSLKVSLQSDTTQTDNNKKIKFITMLSNACCH